MGGIIHFLQVLEGAEGASVVEEQGLGGRRGLLGRQMVLQNCLKVRGCGGAEINDHRDHLVGRAAESINLCCKIAAQATPA